MKNLKKGRLGEVNFLINKNALTFYIILSDVLRLLVCVLSEVSGHDNKNVGIENLDVSLFFANLEALVNHKTTHLPVFRYDQSLTSIFFFWNKN